MKDEEKQSKSQNQPEKKNCKHGQNKNCDCKHEKHDDCGCHGGENCECHGEHHSAEETQKQYQELFNSLTAALGEAEKQLKKAHDEILDNQRLAVSYKKDLERYKERNKNIETDAKNNATECVAAKIIPILDQFETALSAATETAETKGYQMIYTGLKKVVEDLGISEIAALGEKFDSNFHNAVSKASVKDKSKDGVVTAVYQKGYKLNSTDKIIRYAMVEIGEYIK